VKSYITLGFNLSLVPPVVFVLQAGKDRNDHSRQNNEDSPNDNKPLESSPNGPRSDFWLARGGAKAADFAHRRSGSIPAALAAQLFSRLARLDREVETTGTGEKIRIAIVSHKTFLSTLVVYPELHAPPSWTLSGL
jgi:hypothetical protein